ncbi:hypothetical protein AAFC00_003507 [Neodothiora populina]|uniref:DUF7624 domain-containing protein n=1 Tax=Neodothiora populina TaxID=2781224 RepID=A0ABR3PFH2_9PEZI
MALVMQSPTQPLSSTLTDSPGSPSSLRRSSNLAPPPSPYPQHVDPSPTDSNGTESTDIDEDLQEEEIQVEPGSAVGSESTSPPTQDSLAKITTDLPARLRASSDDEPRSVIHAPTGRIGFGSYSRSNTIESTYGTTVRSSQRSRGSPVTPDAAEGRHEKRMSMVSVGENERPAIERDSTSLASFNTSSSEEVRGSESPSSQTDTYAEDESTSPHLHDIMRDHQSSMIQKASAREDVSDTEETVTAVPALQTALGECWVLCNTLATLSSSHRDRVFTSASSAAQEYAWQSCWRLCQKLYESYDSPVAETLSILELCRDFSQALFEVRHRGDEATDSVLRVSFEMNNHLYNTHDRHLPEAFRERTLDFYVTICHRMMKQRTTLTVETDALLRACWSLAEMLFNLRQARREQRFSDDDLLGSAVQACWELCDLFREGWTQARPERGTPRPSQPQFPHNVRGSGSSIHSTIRSTSSLSSSSYHDAPALPPETPITIFDDTTTAASSPASMNNPNILVLGTISNGTLASGSHHNRWSSNASILSGYAESAGSSSTATASKQGSHLFRLQYLILKAAMNAGFNRTSVQSFSVFVKSLPGDGFGPLLWQKRLLQRYKSLVDADASLRALNNLPSRRLTGTEVAKAVDWLAREDKWAWLRDLYRLVCDVKPEEVLSNTIKSIYLQA